jgi:hypothetical protein
MAELNDIFVKTVFTAEVIAASGVATSDMIDLGTVTVDGNFGIQLALTGDGTAQVDYTASNHTEDFITPSTASAIVTGFVKTSGPGSDGKDAFAFIPILHRFMKIQVTETGTSDSITVTAYLATQ